MTDRAVVRALHRRLLAAPAVDGPALRAEATRLARAAVPLLAADDVAQLVDEVLAEVQGLGPLESLMADPAVTDVMVARGAVWIERAGELGRATLTLTDDDVVRLAERIVAPLGLRVDRAAPIVDARLADGSRVHVVLPPVAVDGPCLTIRRFGARAVPLDDFGPAALVDGLRAAVRSRRSILVAGGTGAGKTTLLNALGGEIDRDERIVTVEDTAELQLPGDHVVRLEARPPNAEGAGEVRVRDLVRAALRMRPDRIIVGECRGAEALDMVQAMNTGHHGSMSTCHANSPDDAIRRIETMVLMADVALPLTAVREQVASSLDLVVQVARGRHGRRVVVDVAEVVPPHEPGGPVTTRPSTAFGGDGGRR